MVGLVQVDYSNTLFNIADPDGFKFLYMIYMKEGSVITAPV